MGKTHLVKAVQEAVLEAVQDIQLLGLPKLGPEFAQLRGTDLHQALVAHRATKAFERPNARGASKRRESSIRGFLDTNASLGTDFDYRRLDRASRGVFLGARAWLSEILGGFTPTYRFAFPSGEGVISSGGLTDFYWKLVRDDQWTCSLDAVPYAARVAYRNHALKRVVRERFRKTQPYGWENVARRWYAEAKASGIKGIGLYVFERMFLRCVEIIGVSRVTTVPKNNEKDRVITCEPTWNMVAQLSLALDLRELLRRKTGIDIQYWQEVHKSLIRSGRATIDFSDASNRNRWDVVKALFPQRVVRHLSRLRNTVFEYDDKYYPVSMLAPMGCGFTFDMLTLTLLAYARQFDPAATAFGDDIIISPTTASQFIAFVEQLSWKVNHQKSYISGNFRESCGGFCDLSEDKMLQSYDFTWPADEQSAYILANKIARTVGFLPPCSVREVLSRCFDKLLKIFPRDSWVEDFGGPLEDWLFFAGEEGTTNATTSVAVVEWSRMWQRPIKLRSAALSRAETTNVGRRGWTPSLQMACFLRLGGSYDPPTGKFKAVRETRDRHTGTTLSGVTLVSIL